MIIEIADNKLGLFLAMLIAFLLLVCWIRLYNKDKLKGVAFYCFPLLALVVLLAAMIKFML